MKQKKLLHRIFNTIAWLCILLVIFAGLTLAYSRYIAPYDFSVTETKIQSSDFTVSENAIKILQFSDTHLGFYYTLKDFEKVINAINKEKPDIIIFSGDLIDSLHDYSEDTTKLKDLLGTLEAPYGKYCVFGNHDYGGGSEKIYPEIMEAAGFKLLKNSNIQIQSLNINIIGIDDVLIGYGDVEAASKTRTDYFNLVIAHEPDIANMIAQYDVDLMLSSHTHGRQINIGLLSKIKVLDNYTLPPYGRHYIEGLYEFSSDSKMKLYVTRGIGTTQLPLRFNSKPELSVFILSKDQ
jgi:predicted MPP superfamily phosphohydrolase